VEVAEALLGTLEVMVEGKERLFALAEKERLLFPRVVHLAQLFRQRNEKLKLGLGDVAGWHVVGLVAAALGGQG
jgi:hypothetical protein